MMTRARSLLCLLAGLSLLVPAVTAGPNPSLVAPPDPYYNVPTGPLGTQGNVDTAGRATRSPVLNTGVANLVLFFPGQSNNAGEAPTAYTLTNASVIDNFNVNDGALYAPADPPIGATPSAGAQGCGCSLTGWRVADTLVTNGKFARVIVVPLAITGTSVAQWDTGPLSTRICQAIGRLKDRGIVPGTNVTFAADWGQGEADQQLGTSQAAYTTALNDIISKAAACGFSGRWFINVETWEAGATSAAVQAAQAAVVNGTTVFAGANIDSFGSGDRQSDNTHINDTGAPLVAAAKVAAMHASGAPF
jgi:hypothetical protein